MSEGANPNEADNLATGNRIHHLGPLTGAGIVVWTCSDLLNDEDDDLQEQVRKYVKRGNILVHPQCNPKPFHPEWTNFRSSIFTNKNDVTYICANWGMSQARTRTTHSGGTRACTQRPASGRHSRTTTGRTITGVYRGAPV